MNIWRGSRGKFKRNNNYGKNYAKAWCSLSPKAVASFYAPDGQIIINRGDAVKGRDAIFIWTLEGHHSETKNYVKVGGWKEWELDENTQVKSSLGWFDASEHERQIAEGM